MKLDEVKYFLSECQHKLVGVDCSLFYFHDNSWHSLGSKHSIDIEFGSCLRRAKECAIAYHASRSHMAWYYFEEIDAVILLKFNASPNRNKQEQYRKSLEDIRRGALNAYKVDHNELTGLLARGRFRATFELQLNEFAASIASLGSKAEAITEDYRALTMFLLALDIDKFKQVNDTFGHLYGDQVLKSFALRLENAAETVRQRYAGANVWLSHPSGEEFNVLVRGRFSQSDVLEIAEAFRSEVEREALPSNAEWIRLSRESELSSFTLPSIHDRKVTTSIGLAFCKPTIGGQSLTGLLMQLLESADTALYRSKAGGRNCVTFFDDILAKWGRILEHNVENGVVAIDIGSKVGVEFGQEFIVYDETFSGRMAFTIDDGRSKRTLGHYPKVPLARIVVFDVQKDISFARIAPDSKATCMIRPNSRLEAVPLGSFMHVLESATSEDNYLGQSVVLSTPQELQKEIERQVERKASVWAAIFSFQGQAEYLQKFGSVSLNRALAALYAELDGLSSVASAKKGLIDKTSICIVGHGEAIDSEQIERLIRDRNFGPNGGLQAIGGYYDGYARDKNDNSSNLQSERDQKAIEWARYALTDFASAVEVKFQRFDILTVERRLNRYILAKQREQGLADYLHLRNLGITSGVCVNAAGIFSYIGGKSMDALKFFQEAGAMLSSINIKINILLAAESLNDVEAGLKALTYEELLDVIKNDDNIHVAYSYASLQLRAKESGLPGYDFEKFKSAAEKVAHVQSLQDYPRLNKIKEALSMCA